MKCQFCRKNINGHKKERSVNVSKRQQVFGKHSANWAPLFVHDYCHGGYLARQRMLEAIEPQKAQTQFFGRGIPDMMNVYQKEMARQMAIKIDQDILNAIAGVKP